MYARKNLELVESNHEKGIIPTAKDRMYARKSRPVDRNSYLSFSNEYSAEQSQASGYLL